MFAIDYEQFPGDFPFFRRDFSKYSQSSKLPPLGRLEAAIRNRTPKLAGSRESLRAVANTVQQIVEFGYPNDYFDTFVAKVRNVRIADVQDAAKSVMRPDSLIWIIVGDRAKIEAGIRELSLGEVRLIDADGNPIQ